MDSRKLNEEVIALLKSKYPDLEVESVTGGSVGALFSDFKIRISEPSAILNVYQIDAIKRNHNKYYAKFDLPKSYLNKRFRYSGVTLEYIGLTKSYAYGRRGHLLYKIPIKSVVYALKMFNDPNFAKRDSDGN